jgi:hypothetical protein
MLALMAAPTSIVSFPARGVVAIAAAILIVLKAVAFAPAHAHGAPGIAVSGIADVGYCATGEGPPLTPAPCGHSCVLCAAAAAWPAPGHGVQAIAAPPPSTVRPLPSRLRLGRAPPGWASSWSSQAPPPR